MKVAVEPSESYTVERHFEDAQAWVTLPMQAHARALVISGPLDFPGDMPPTPGVFEPTRLVLNFQVTEGDGSTVVHRFSPPMVLRVQITDAEFEQVAAGYKLKLGFWDETRWVPFTKKKHQFEVHSHFAIALIRDWGDPCVAWGR